MPGAGKTLRSKLRRQPNSSLPRPASAYREGAGFPHFTSASRQPACSSARPGTRRLWLLRQTARTGHISPFLYPSCMEEIGKEDFGNSRCSLPNTFFKVLPSSFQPNPPYVQQPSGPLRSGSVFPNPKVSSIPSHTGRGRGESRRKRRRKGGRWEERGQGGEVGPTVPAEWFQASAGTASPARLRRVNTSDTVRLLWVLLEASSGTSPEVPPLRVPCSERYEPGCSGSGQSVDDLWAWGLGDSTCLPTRPGESSAEFKSRLLFQALRTVTCLASEEPASKGALWLFHLIVSAGGAWLFLSTGSDGLITMLLRETTVSGLFFRDPSPVLSASLSCRVMSCL